MSTTDQTTGVQEQLPGVDWSRYETREVPTDAEIEADLPDDHYYWLLSEVLFQQYGVTVIPMALKVADVIARKQHHFDELKAAIGA